MCAWNTTFPDGSKSVKANELIGQQNTTYTKTTINVDHQWNVGEDEDGHHKFAQMAGYEDEGDPEDPDLATGMDLVYYAKEKTAAEATAQQDVQPFAKISTNVMQLLGIRAMAVFDCSGGAFTTVYSHNCTITRTELLTQGRFTATFSTEDMPSVNYAFLGGGVAYEDDTGATVSCEVEANLTLANVKTTSFVKFRTIVNKGTSTTTRNVRDPLQAYFIVFGG